MQKWDNFLKLKRKFMDAKWIVMNCKFNDMLVVYTFESDR